jgi:cysteine desulfurase
MFAPVYLDHNATTPLDDRVLDAMLPFLRERCGNASSRHEYGRAARDAIERARYLVADAAGAHATEVIFTSGGSEANNLFLKGVAASIPVGTLLMGATEHPCVVQPGKQLQALGWRVCRLPVDVHGALDTGAGLRLVEAERPGIVSVMLANNETGVINPIKAVMLGARQQGAWVHTDAVQAFGKLPLNFRELGVHGMTLSAHKIYGPIGAGALVLDKRVDLQPLIAGGGQERELRSGTENVAAIVGFGRACELLSDELAQRVAHMQALHSLLEHGVMQLGAELFCVGATRLPNTSFLAFRGLEGETLVGKLDRAGFAVASGAACSSATPLPSASLLAMGVAPELARCAVRVSVGYKTSVAEVERFLSVLKETVQDLRQLTAVAV